MIRENGLSVTTPFRGGNASLDTLKPDLETLPHQHPICADAWDKVASNVLRHAAPRNVEQELSSRERYLCGLKGEQKREYIGTCLH